MCCMGQVSAVSQVKTEEDFKVFHAKQILIILRLVTYRGNDTIYWRYCQTASRRFLVISANESRSFELDKK